VATRTAVTWEKGEKRPNSRNRKRLAKVLGVSVDGLGLGGLTMAIQIRSSPARSIQVAGAVIGLALLAGCGGATAARLSPTPELTIAQICQQDPSNAVCTAPAPTDAPTEAAVPTSTPDNLEGLSALHTLTPTEVVTRCRLC